MQVCVDTSVWVSYLRGANAGTDRLETLLEADEVAMPILVRLELLSGASSKNVERLQRLFSAVPTLIPTTSTWERVEDWIRVAVLKGHRFGVADLLIGALSTEYDCPLWSLDSDFDRMASLGFVQRFSSH